MFHVHEDTLGRSLIIANDARPKLFYRRFNDRR